MVTQYKNLIGGKMVGTDRWLDVVNPANEQVIGQVPATWVPQPNPDEVGAVFSVPLSAFLDRAKHR